ncbi:hypothetical protein BSNK01_03380 [Bacillaceae bacterium]
MRKKEKDKLVQEVTGRLMTVDFYDALEKEEVLADLEPMRERVPVPVRSIDRAPFIR